MIAGGSVLTLSGCTDTTASDETERSEEIESFEGNGESVDDPSPISQSDLSGSLIPDEPPEWIETNMDFRGYYDAYAYQYYMDNPGASGEEYKHWKAYFAHYGDYLIDVIFPKGQERRYDLEGWFSYHYGGTGPVEISVVGSSAKLRAYNPGSQGNEVWFGGAVGLEYYWIGLFN